MNDQETRPPRRTWPAFAVVGFIGGVLTVIFLVWLWNHVLH